MAVRGPLVLRPSSDFKYTIKITGLPERITEEKLRRFVWLQSADEGITSVRIFAGYALINYSRETSLESVCSKLDHKHFNGFTLRAKIKGTDSMSQPAAQYFTVKVHHLSQYVTEEELKTICSRFGFVTSVKLNEGYGYVNFSSLASAQGAIDHLNSGVSLGGQTVSAKMHYHQASVYSAVRPPQPSGMHLPSTCTTSFVPSQFASSAIVKVKLRGRGLSGNDLLHYFREFGTIEGVPVIQPGTPDYAYVNFCNLDDAKRACKIDVVQLKAVKLTIKLCDKPRISIPKVDTQGFVTDDSIVNQLLAKDCFNELEKKLTKFNVSIKPLEAFTGLQITGNQEDVVKAKVLLDTEVDILKMKITKKLQIFPCSMIPLFSNHPHLFQDLQQKHSTEFSLLRNDGSEETLVLFCDMIATYSKKPTPMKLALFDGYSHKMPQNGKSTRRAKRKLGSCQTAAREFTIQCRGLEANVATSLHELREAVDKASSTTTVEVDNLLENMIFQVACDYCVVVQRLPGALSLKGDMEYVRKVSFHLQEKIVEARDQPISHPPNDLVCNACVHE